MESYGKIKLIFVLVIFSLISLCITGCKTLQPEVVEDPLVLAEITPLPKTVEKKKVVLYEPIYGVMRILEISSNNGVQTDITAKKGDVTKGLDVGAVGEIAADAGFGEIIGTCKITGVVREFVTFKIVNVTKKIPSNSYVRIVVGEKVKGE